MAYQFDGSGDYIIDSTDPLDYNSDYTVMFWIYYESGDGLYALRDSAVTDTDYFGLSSGFPAIYFQNGASSDFVTGGTLDADEWHHVALQRDGNTLRFIVDAVQQVQTLLADPASRPAIDSEIFMSGGPSDIEGRVAAFKSFTSALTLGEIAAEMNVGYKPHRDDVWDILHFVESTTKNNASGQGDWTENGTPSVVAGPLDVPWDFYGHTVVGVSAAAASVVIEPTASTLTLSTVNPTVVLGSLTITPTVSTANLTTVDPVVVKGALTTTPTPSTLNLSTVNPTVLLGGITRTPAPSTLNLSTVNPTVVLGALTTTPTPAEINLSTVNPTVVKGALTITPATSDLTLATVDPTVVTGGLTLTPTPSSLALSTINPTVVLGAVTITPTPAAINLSTVDPTVVNSNVITPTPSTLNLQTVNPTVVLGALTRTPATADLTLSTVDPNVDLGSIIITPAPATLNLSTEYEWDLFYGEGDFAAAGDWDLFNDFTIAGGVLTFGDTSIGTARHPAVWDSGDWLRITFTLSNFSAGDTANINFRNRENENLNAIAGYGAGTHVLDIYAKVDGTDLSMVAQASSSGSFDVDNWTVRKLGSTGGVLVEPDTADLTLVTVDPTTVLGALTVTPSPNEMVLSTIDPTVSLGSLILTPTPATLNLSEYYEWDLLQGVGAFDNPSDWNIFGSATISGGVARYLDVDGVRLRHPLNDGWNEWEAADWLRVSFTIGNFSAGNSAFLDIRNNLNYYLIPPTSYGAGSYVIDVYAKFPSAFFDIVCNIASSGEFDIDDVTVRRLGSTGTLFLEADVPADIMVATFAPTVVKGPLSVTPTPAVQLLSTVDPTIVKGAVSITPAAALLNFQTIDPAIFLGLLSVPDRYLFVVLSESHVYQVLPESNLFEVIP